MVQTLKTARVFLVLTGMAFILFFLWHPVCVPLVDEDLRAYSVPIESRKGESIWGIQTFQKKNGRWCQCKPWLARQMFF
jgi:hypothetical protein